MQYAVIGVREHEDGGGDGGGGEGNDGETSGLDGGTVTKAFSSDGPGLCWPSALSSFSAIGERPFLPGCIFRGRGSGFTTCDAPK